VTASRHDVKCRARMKRHTGGELRRRLFATRRPSLT
jgi:hypothetical protein